MRILLIEDDKNISESVEIILKMENYEVRRAFTGQEGIDRARVDDYDLILLDLGLPDISGFDVLRKLRSEKIDIPVLIVSGLLAVNDKVRGLGFGADDYMTKPFHRTELLARIQAVIRRSRDHAPSTIGIGNLIVNLDSKCAEINGTQLNLTGKEYEILEVLAIRTGATLTKEMLLNHLYTGRDEPELKIIDVFICQLRKKLGSIANSTANIQTVWGRGYVLREQSIDSLAN